jgi:glycosyltransferase involved in cell wall biosynthesis
MSSRTVEPSKQEAVTAVIPAHNEQKCIGKVLELLRDVSSLSQIVVIDDGSTDKTAVMVRQKCHYDERIQLICLPKNQGKAIAMHWGIKASENDILLFLDADLMHVTPEHIKALIAPIQDRSCHMTLGVFTNGRRQTDLSHKLTPFLSGQRCLRWSHFCLTPGLEQAKWGVETALSFYAWHQQYDVRHIRWSGATHDMRPEKRAGWDGYLSHMQMWYDIAAYLLRYALWRNLTDKSVARSKKWLATLSFHSGD